MITVCNAPNLVYSWIYVALLNEGKYVGVAPTPTQVKLKKIVKATACRTCSLTFYICSFLNTTEDRAKRISV